MIRTQSSPASSPILPCKHVSISSVRECDDYLLKSSPPPFSIYHLSSSIFSTIPAKKELPSPVIKCSKLSNHQASSFDFVKKDESLKRKVKFADEIGLPLFKVLKFYESPYDPPTISKEVVLTEVSSTELLEDNAFEFEMLFKQPASDYMGFRDKLGKLNISLENVMMKQGSCNGTVKVKNLSYEKYVFVRFTWDEWETYQDVSTSYLPPGLFLCNREFDTFSFEIILSDVKTKQRFDCCVYMRCDDEEFWDNNNGSNYTILFSEKGSLDSCNEKIVEISTPYW